MPTAGYQLSQIAELVEIILCDVQPRDVLLWQRVCQVWKGTIDGSKQLQRCFALSRRIVERMLMKVGLHITPMHIVVLTRCC